MLHTNLAKFSSHAKSEPSSVLPPHADTPEQLKHLEAVQQQWVLGQETTYVMKSLQQLHRDHIDASSGSSGFLPPEGVEKSLREDIETDELTDYNNHLLPKTLIAEATEHFKQQNIIPQNATIGSDPYDDKNDHDFYAMHGHGTTELFSFILRSLVKTPGDIIVLSTPTYGLFIEPITQAKANIATFALTQKNNYKPTPAELRKLILANNKNAKNNYLSVIAVTLQLLTPLFATNKTHKKEYAKLKESLSTLKQTIEENPDSEDFSRIDSLTQLYNDTLLTCLPAVANAFQLATWQDKLTLPLCTRVRGYFHINPHMPMGTILNQEETEKLAQAIMPFSDITVIDDITYNELVLPPCKVQPGTFAKTKTMQNRCVTLYSLSKQYGVAAIRAGLAIGPKSVIKPLAHAIFMHVNMPSVYSQKALHFIFKMPLADKTKHLQETLDEYAFRRDLAIAMVLGISKIVDKNNSDKIVKTLKQQKLLVALQQSLLQGIPGLTITHIPHSGFFLLLDFSAFKGKYIGDLKLETSMDMHKFICCLTDVDMIPGELNLDFTKPLLRFSFCIPPKDIIEAFIRIGNVLKLCNDKMLKDIPSVDKPKKAKIKSSDSKPKIPLDLSAKKPKSYTPQFDKKATPLFMPETKPAHQHGTRLKKIFDRRKGP